MDTKDNNYVIASGLVHKLIVAIFAALIGIAGYMAVWAIQDAQYKSEMRVTSKHQAEQLDRINDILLKHLDGHPRSVERRVEENVRRIERLEEE